MDTVKNRIIKILIFISLILIFLVSFISTKKTAQILEVPPVLTHYELETTIMSKITDPIELDFVLSKYAQKDKNSNKYYLITNNPQEIKKVKTILINNGYYIDISEREIETPIKKYINGYLGQFFRFQYFNPFNWLIIPLIIYFLINYKKQNKKLIIFILFYILASIIISLKGYTNFRYQLTFHPITLIFLFNYYFQLISKFKINKIKPFLSFLLILLIIINSLIYNISLIKQSIRYVEKNNTKIAPNNTTDQPSKFDPNNYSIDKKSITGMVNFINNLQISPNTKILNNNLPFLYYYTDKTAVYYYAEIDTYFTEKGANTLTLNTTLNNLHDFIKDDLQCSYVLSSNSHNQYNFVLKKFLETKTELLFQSGDFLFYKIN